MYDRWRVARSSRFPGRLLQCRFAVPATRCVVPFSLGGIGIDAFALPPGEHFHFDPDARRFATASVIGWPVTSAKQVNAGEVLTSKQYHRPSGVQRRSRPATKRFIDSAAVLHRAAIS